MDTEQLYKNLPDKKFLIEWFGKKAKRNLPEINGHIHTPHSFSAFSDIGLAFQMARQEGIEVLGINDFYTTDGYSEFAAKAMEFKIFPLFNIEFMALQKELQESGVRVNDPNNPGRTYFSGKGLRYPVQMSASSEKTIDELQQESNRQTYQMVDKLNRFLSENEIELKFDAAAMHNELGHGLFRERHIAQGIRQAVFSKSSSADGRSRFFKELFAGNDLKAPLGNIAMVENEIRGNLLKSGGAAFVPEDPKAFLSLQGVIDLIIDAGGIPCYPVLLDNTNGEITDYEVDKQVLLETLTKNDIWSVEFIPGRNNYEVLKDYVSFFHNNGFVVTFGTEHNTPQLDPMTIKCRGGIPLDTELKAVNYEGAAVIAAHQYLMAHGKEGYLDGREPKKDMKEDFVNLGKAVIAWFCQEKAD